ncbi:sporulation-specific protein 15-like [Temnothorax curvispinosus]|uniref:Sporulation-specific protein 15-like n=1 Tax=Temnothorax curvispinosus TaxID=300111 RepID=A0A6J1PZ38_9HYME|nr:sporulation-specific protein 15-like [Temnothorax curvispinosus]XP_024875178.1 sporulation-specific protein 15-like [Temnothorax curvispinosus]XP_024875179.1 sporulation-specific protein 15-like [Temnothorax curvispinosus]XP_024875180.1 sporulation-specific protein 15-like [Temnothorax curvispinosus]XP_024875181.1 sporulation-specific protein 15-like [Temnothorax curvispinosus]XP_024875182.1 sporulation-specific protein 15-like [Temnothorax curvispinosus]
MHSVSASLPSSTDVSDGPGLVKRDQDIQDCRAADVGTDGPCGETEGLRILDEFRKLYESRIEKIDRESGGDPDRVFLKLQVMSDWIKDLGEQNAMLVHTVEDLEQAACSRVKLLEEKLNQSSQIVMDNLTRADPMEKTLNTLSNRVSQLEKDEEYLQQKIEYLQSDIRGLLEVIRRARRQNVWSLEGITFFEIQPEDIPVQDCICSQEQTDTDHIKSLNLQIEQLQENERKMIRCQLELEGKVTDLTTELSVKDDTIKKYVSRLQCFCEKLKEHAKQANQVIGHPLAFASDQDCNIILTPDILESVLDAKDRENKSLHRQLQDVESKLIVYTYENNVDTINLQLQLEEKCKKVQQLEDKVARLEKEAVETKDTLTAEIVALEKQNYHANIGNLLKDDLIKEMRKGLKQTALEDTSSQKVRIDANNSPEKCPLPSIDTPHSKKDEFVSLLNSTKAHVQKECEILSDLKLELEKFVNKLTKDNEVGDCIISNNCTNKNKLCASGMSDKLIDCIEIITKMYLERENEVIVFDCMVKKEESRCVCGDSKNIKENVNSVRQFKLMEEFRVCTVEAQAATEDIREEISTVISTFNSRHQNYEDLNEMVTNAQSYLAKTREGLIEAINRLELQEEERLRHSERIVNGNLKLKDIKNEINHVQSELSRCVNGMQGNVQEYNESEYTKACVNSDLLTVVMEEVEQILTNLQLFQTQGGCMTSILKGLRSQLCTVDSSLKELQKKAGEVLLNNEIAQTTFCEREIRLAKFEEEVDCAHTKMQDVLETFLSTKQEEKEQFSHYTYDNQEVNDIIKAKEDLHKLRKEYDDLKLDMIQQTCQMKYDERLNKWRNRITDLEDQVRMLQHEAKCKQEAINFLKNNIQSMEKELFAARTKAENYRQCHSKDSTELKKKIIELENIIKAQKEVENDLRKNLNNVANIKKSAEIPNAYHTECGTEAMLLRCDYPSKHENLSHLFKTVQDAVQSAKMAVQNFESELKKLIHEESLSSVSAKSAVTLTDSLGKCREKLDTCSHELSKLKNAVYSKEKLLENMEEIVRIQRNSLAMSQTEVKDLHQKLQEKVDKQGLTIAQYEREKNELLKQNELQIQTIGHLQNAVVEAKRNLDQMAHKTMSDLCKKDEIIRQLTMRIDETQDQYNECFTQATNQDMLLDLQRDAIESLHKQIRCLEYNKRLSTTALHAMYYSILSGIQERIRDHVKDFRELKWKMDSFIQTKNYSESQNKSCAIYLEDKNCDTRDLEYYSNSITCGISYVERRSDKEAEIETIVQIQQLKAELKKVKDTESGLKCENQQLKINLQHHISETDNLMKKLQRIKQKETEYEELLLKLENGKKEINTLNDRIISNEEIIKHQSHELEVLRKRLLANDQQAEENLSELNVSEHEMLTILCDRMCSLKILLQEKSNNMVKLQADYELLKNENSILKSQNDIIETQTKEDILQLKERLKETRIKLRQTEDNYQQMTENFNKVQKQLISATEREADLQESLTIMEKDYRSKIVEVEDEAVYLRNLVDKLSEELEETKRTLASKDIELCQAQDKWKDHTDHLDIVRQDLKKKKEELTKAENVNRDLIQQLQEYMENNYHLDQQKISLERNNSTYIIELQNMRKSLLELKKECHLKDRSLTHMSADLTETAMSRSELCKESQYILSCIRDCMEQQKKYNETLTKNLENKQQLLMQLVFEKKALLIKIRKMKQTNLLAQKLKRTHKLTTRGFRKVHINGYVSSSITAHQTADTDQISNLNCTDLRKKYLMKPIKTGRRTSTCGNSWWFPKMEHLINEVRKNNRWWHENFKNETESDTSLEENRDYGYQSSSTSK